MDVEYVTEDGEIIVRREESHVPRVSTWVLIDGSLWEVTYVAKNHESGCLEATVGGDRVDVSA
jgi:hypothetical protein